MSSAETFACTGFARFLNSTAGRVLRIAIGVAMIVWGYIHIGQTSGVALMLLGCIALIAGAMDYCLVSTLLGSPMAGWHARKAASKK